MISTLFHRTKAVCSTKQQLQEEHLQKVLTRCKYPRWALNRIKNKISAPNQPKGSSNSTKKTTNSSTNTNSVNKRNSNVVPYTKDLSENIKTVSKKHGVQVYFKWGKTMKDLLVAPKDKDPITMKHGIIYRFKCDRMECDEEYIGESARTFGEWCRFLILLK